MLVQQSLAEDPFDGAVFAFRGRRAGLIKLIWHDGIGLCMLTKRLEQRPVRLAVGDHDRPDRVVLGATGGVARRMRVAGAGAAPQTGTGRINSAVCAQQILAPTRRHRSSLRRADRPRHPAGRSRPCCSRCCANCTAENDKLRLLIQRLTRHQFGRRSEQLSADQLQFGLEDLEQTVAENQAAQDAAEAAGGQPAKPRAARPDPQSRRVAGASAALRGGDRCRARRLPLLRRRHALHRRIAHRAARHRAGAAAGAGDAPSALRLPQPARKPSWWRRRRRGRSMAACRPRR